MMVSEISREKIFCNIVNTVTQYLSIFVCPNFVRNKLHNCRMSKNMSIIKYETSQKRKARFLNNLQV